MRVLHVNAGNLYGGVETLLVTLARWRDLCPEMEPSFALSFQGQLSQELVETGVPVYQLGEVRASRYWTIHRARRTLRRFLNDHRWDLVVTHMSWSHAVFGPEVRRARLPVVNWVHGISTGRSWVDRWAARTPSDLMIYNSRFTQSVVSTQFRDARNEVLYYPVTALAARAADRDAIRRELGVASDTTVILQVSRMEWWKGHRLHIDALAQLKDLDGWVCWMAGGAQRREEREYLTDLQRRAAEAGIGDRLHFLGHRSDVPSLMAAADIFCQPNEGPEPFGIVFIEALQAGLPVVSTRMGGACEIVDESCGVLVPPHDPGVLATHLRRFIKPAADRRLLAQGGPRRAQALCDPRTQLARLFQVLAATA